jgi:hypothetical protein
LIAITPGKRSGRDASRAASAGSPAKPARLGEAGSGEGPRCVLSLGLVSYNDTEFFWPSF